MIYKFKSKVTGDLIMTGQVGDAILRLLGRAPTAQGIIEAPQLGSAIQALESAIAADEASRTAPPGQMNESDSTTPPDTVSLRQRAWPLIEMMKRCRTENADIVWGV